MQTINLIGVVSMIYPKELPEINNNTIFAIKSNGIQHTIAASGEFKNIAKTLIVGQHIDIICDVSYQLMSSQTVTIIHIRKLTLL